MRIFSLHWIMQNNSFLMSPRRPSSFADIKSLMFGIIQCKLKNLHFNPYYINRVVEKKENEKLAEHIIAFSHQV